LGPHRVQFSGHQARQTARFPISHTAGELVPGRVCRLPRDVARPPEFCVFIRYDRRERWMARGIHLSAARYAASPTDCAHSTGCAHPSGSDPAGMWRKPTRLRARPRRQRTGFRAQRLWPDVAAMGDHRDYQWPGSRRKTVDERWTIL
jgi:hypothetical protein